MTKEYYGTKKVTAWKQEKDGKPGYAVKYADGYISWSPKDVFEEAYKASGEMNFGHALIALKEGVKVARSGWNSKGMFLYHVPANSYPAQTDIAKAYWGAKQAADNPAAPMVPYGAYIAMKTAQENVVPWLASQTDVLAEDWAVVE
jgi:hypothetical protein